MTQEQIKSAFKNVVTVTLEGTKLWETQEEAYHLEAEALVSKNGNIYMRFDAGDGRTPFIHATGKLYDEVATLEQGNYPVTIQLAKPIEGVTEEQLQEAYGENSPNPQPRAISNYKTAIKKGAQRFVLTAIHE